MSLNNSVNKPAPRIFSIPPSVNFLKCLASNLLKGKLIPGVRFDQDWTALAETTIFLPTRQSARTLTDIFRDIASGRVIILPKIRPLGDVDEIQHMFRPVSGLGNIPDEMGPLERQLAMTRLIMKWSEASYSGKDGNLANSKTAFPASPADAAWLAQELLYLIDQVEREEANWSDLANVVPEDYAEYWQMTLEFLDIAIRAWPSFLKEQDKMNPSARRSELIRREADLLQEHGSKGPVIAAGSTGTVPATAQLLKTISMLPNGAVVLPGLDLSLDQKSWDLLESGRGEEEGKIASHPAHPQYGLAKLLSFIGVNRSEVVQMCQPSSKRLAIRERLVSEVMRPVDTTDEWIRKKGDFTDQDRESAFDGCAYIESANDIEEGLSVSLVLREAVENRKTAALVTPDRTLARRVISELKRWSIDVDDSTGESLQQTGIADFTRLVNRTALNGMEPVLLLSLLKHRFTQLKLKPLELVKATKAIERGVLRGPRPEAGMVGLKNAIAAAKKIQKSDPNVPTWRRLSSKDWMLVDKLVDRLGSALSPLLSLHSGKGTVPIRVLAQATLKSVQMIGTNANNESDSIFGNPSGEVILKFFSQMIEEENSGLAILPEDWPSLFETLIYGIPVYNRRPSDPRIRIYSPIENRLLQTDLIVLAGLNEGIWPSTIKNDPWLNRPMKGEIGLEQPERRTGLVAHDFTQGLGMERVVLSRSLRSGGTPTVASRWIQRLFTVIGESVVLKLKHRGQKYLDWTGQMDGAGNVADLATRPCPKPPVAHRPKKLSVTGIETWVRDPYAIYARHVLNLTPIDPIGGHPGAAEKGTIIHECLADFLNTWQGEFNKQAYEKLIKLGRHRFESISAFPELQALWWPRFNRIAEWFVFSFERGRSTNLNKRFLECRGSMKVPTGFGDFQLTGRADRIDVQSNGQVSLLDYKTGQAPSSKQVYTLLSPQLPLEAAMLIRQGFEGVPKSSEITELAYIVLRGGRESGTVESRIPKDTTVIELANKAFTRLQEIVRAYQSPEMGYLSRARVFKELSFDSPFDHLARVREWSVGIDEEDEN